MDTTANVTRCNQTFPNGFTDLLTNAESRRHNAGGYELQPGRLPLFNDALHRISPESPSLTLDQVTSAARRVLERYAMGATPAFVESRMLAWERLDKLAADPCWSADAEVRARIDVVREYLANPNDLLPDHLPTLGKLDDAMLVDLAFQQLRAEIADYADFCQFRDVAAAFAGVSRETLELTREQWLEAVDHHARRPGWDRDGGMRFAPADPRITLFHVV